MNPAALARLRAVMGSLKKAGKLGVRRAKKSVGRVVGKSAKRANANATVAAALGSVKRHTRKETRPISKAEQVYMKLQSNQRRVKRIGKRVATDVGVGAGLVGGVAALKAMRNKKKKKQLVRRAQ